MGIETLSADPLEYEEREHLVKQRLPWLVMYVA
jgi:hypothetical protein